MYDSLPKLFVHSNSVNIYVQVIDNNEILTEAITQIKFLKSPKAIISAAKMIGHAIAKTNLQRGISKLTFESRTPFTNFTKILTSTIKNEGLIL